MSKMTIYDITKENYAKAKGDDNKMWNSTKLLSDTICTNCNMSENDYWRLLKKYYSIMAGEHFNKDFAEWQVSQMWYKDKEGKEHRGAHWTLDQTNEVYEKVKSKLPSDYNNYDFYVTANMIYSDNICMYKTWWADASNDVLDGKVIDATINWLSDSDAEKGKIWRYFNC